jgi:hypothetical protein
MLDLMNLGQWNPWRKRRGIDEIPGGNGRGHHGEIGDALGWTGIEGQSLLQGRASSSWEREENEVFFVGRQMNG